jgi:hypothetical protein
MKTALSLLILTDDASPNKVEINLVLRARVSVVRRRRDNGQVRQQTRTNEQKVSGTFLDLFSHPDSISGAKKEPHGWPR